MPEHAPGYLNLECEPWNDEGGLCLWSDMGQESDDGVHIAEVSGEEVGIEARNANARRIVACWNACEDVSTESIEDYNVLSRLASADRLLAACRSARRAFAELNGEVSRDVWERLYEVTRTLDEAIGKAEG